MIIPHSLGYMHHPLETIRKTPDMKVICSLCVHYFGNNLIGTIWTSINQGSCMTEWSLSLPTESSQWVHQQLRVQAAGWNCRNALFISFTCWSTAPLSRFWAPPGRIFSVCSLICFQCLDSCLAQRRYQSKQNDWI